MKKTLTILVAIALAAALAGCATHYSPDRVDDPYGFFSGIWHGMLFPFALMGKLISWVASLFGVSVLDGVTLLGQPNTGFFYYFGFVWGLGALSGGSRAAT